MCRLALFSNDFFKTFGNSNMVDLFDHLELSQGGDGSGIAIMDRKGKSTVFKGLNIDNKKLVRWLDDKFQNGALYGLFHTRIATHGEICYRNCHPFKHGQYTVAHNGIAMYKQVGNITDSELVTLGMYKSNASPLEFANFAGVWIGFKGRYPFVVKEQEYSQLVYSRYENTNAWMFSSELPYKFSSEMHVSYKLGATYWYKNVCTMKHQRVFPPKKHVSIPERATHVSWEPTNYENETDKIYEEIDLFDVVNYEQSKINWIKGKPHIAIN